MNTYSYNQFQPEATATELSNTSETVPSMECVNRGTGSVGDLNISPDATNIQGEMKSEMSNEEMKKTLMSAIDMKVQAKCEYFQCHDVLLLPGPSC